MNLTDLKSLWQKEYLRYLKVPQETIGTKNPADVYWRGVFHPTQLLKQTHMDEIDCPEFLHDRMCAKRYCAKKFKKGS